jgi:hypothetical protein
MKESNTCTYIKTAETLGAQCFKGFLMGKLAAHFFAHQDKLPIFCPSFPLEILDFLFYNESCKAIIQIKTR